MPDFYSRFFPVIRRLGVGSGLLLALGLLSIQVQAAAPTRSAPRWAVAAALLPNARNAQQAVPSFLLSPQLIIADETRVMSGASFTLPVTLQSHGHTVAATAFSINYDEQWLSFDPADGNGDGVPDALRFRGPASFSLSVMVDNNDRDGEIDVVIADLFPPISALPDGIVVELTLRAASSTSPVDAPVKFSTAPNVSFSTATGQSIPAPSGGVDGVVHILSEPVSTASPTATFAPTVPTLIPSVTPTSSPSPSASPSPSSSPSPSPTSSPSPSPSPTTPSATPSFTPTTSATPTPTVPSTPSVTATPAVDVVVISTLMPDRGGTLLPNEVTVMGRNFADGAVVTLGTNPVTTLATVYISGNYLRVTVPAGLTPGYYDLTVRNPTGAQATLTEAYQVVDQTVNDDLFGQAATFWSDPSTARAQSAVQLGLVVYRQGGRTPLANVTVQFYAGDPEAGGVLIGSGVIPLLSPRGTASTSAVSWTPPAAGAYTLFAVIDPENVVTEGDESNNRIERSLTVLSAAPDTLAPRVDTFVVNNGAISTTVRTAFLDTTASDPTLPPPSSGLGALFFVEYEYSPSAALWVPVQSSGWLAYADAHERFAWQLMPGAGIKYLQAWAADQAGNISAFPAQTLINYLPPTDRVLQNQVRIYRYALTAGQALHVRLLPIQGDPDLYIWPPDYTTRTPWVSNLAGEGVVDEIALVAPVTGIYQVEVYGYSAAEYQLSIATDSVPAAVAAHSAAGRLAEKPLFTQPALALENLPTHHQSLPTVPTQLLSLQQVYLPLIKR